MVADVAGNVMAALKRRGKPLGGNADKIATFAENFEKSSQNPNKFGGYIPNSIFDIGLSGGLGAAGYYGTEMAGKPEDRWMALALGAMARPALRSAIMSGPAQRMMIPRPPGP